MGLTLGEIELDGFEVFARISFGGAQKLAVHQLPGGARVIDAMGPDDDVIAWHGIMSGGDACERAQALDTLRVSGEPVAICWDVFSALVIVSDVKLEYCNSWWIPYQIACTVLTGSQAPDALTTVLADVIADLNQAGLAPGVATALGLVMAPGAMSAGGQAYANAATALIGAGASIAAAVTQAESGMVASDIPSLVTASGSLASLTAASGFVGRATTNFIDLGA